MAIDHKAEKKQAVLKGEDHHRGVVFLDTPKDYTTYSQGLVHLQVRGWEISDCDEGKFIVSLDSQPIEDISREPRPDVFELYQESFAGFIESNTIGWSFNLDLSTLELGKHELCIETVDSLGNVLSNKKVHFTVEE